jgi:hypothetical protein
MQAIAGSPLHELRKHLKLLCGGVGIVLVGFTPNKRFERQAFSQGLEATMRYVRDLRKQNHGRLA